MAGRKITYQILFFGGIVLVVAAVFATHILVNRETHRNDFRKVVSVQRESLSAEIIDRGVVRPAKISPISSLISSNQAKIVWLIKEGARVSKGALVARFDTKPFMDSLHKAEQLYADATASYQASQKLLTLQREEEAGKIEEAERKVEIAEIKSKNIINGSGPLKRKVLMQKLKQAERTLVLNKNELDDLVILLEKGHVSIREKDKARDQVTTAREQVAVAQAEIENFDKYAWPQMLREAELLGNAARSDLERVRRTAELLIQNRMAEVEKNRRKQENKLHALDRAKQDIANCTVLSPTDGIVLYSELPRENGRRKIQIGDSVWVGQTFLEVPDTTELIAEIQVREVDVAKLEVGMKVEIEVDAFPGKIYSGSVAAIASLAEEDAENVGIRRFKTRIEFIGNTDNIHVGMSVTTKIQYRNVMDALVVPVSSIVYPKGVTTVYRVLKGAEVQTPVSVGVQNHLMAEILSGLEVGDVILKEPL